MVKGVPCQTTTAITAPMARLGSESQEIVSSISSRRTSVVDRPAGVVVDPAPVQRRGSPWEWPRDEQEERKKLLKSRSWLSTNAMLSPTTNFNATAMTV